MSSPSEGGQPSDELATTTVATPAPPTSSSVITSSGAASTATRTASTGSSQKSPSTGTGGRRTSSSPACSPVSPPPPPPEGGRPHASTTTTAASSALRKRVSRATSSPHEGQPSLVATSISSGGTTSNAAASQGPNTEVSASKQNTRPSMSARPSSPASTSTTTMHGQIKAPGRCLHRPSQLCFFILNGLWILQREEEEDEDFGLALLFQDDVEVNLELEAYRNYSKKLKNCPKGRTLCLVCHLDGKEKILKHDNKEVVTKFYAKDLVTQGFHAPGLFVVCHPKTLQISYVWCGRHQDKWLIRHAKTVETVDPWDQLLERFRDCRLQPEVLFFEVIK
uniref:Uncharacterized protein n=1 Tax=Oryza brachyantha TaxID=4533 RepID=J3N9G0_ORYBR